MRAARGRIDVALKRCDSGHYYDPGKHASCPSCGVQQISFDKTRAVDDGVRAAAAVVQDRGEPNRPAPSGDGKTVSLTHKKAGIDPVVGWLVCVSGADRGRDFRIRSERNFIGRGQSMDIAIGGDDTISRENHAVVSFNPRSRQFKLHPGESRGLIYLNGDEVDGPVALKAGDHIELGQTKLMLVPLCSDGFSWE
jgi:Inner membrane component of T3SS, cytoplasmic domain